MIDIGRLIKMDGSAFERISDPLKLYSNNGPNINPKRMGAVGKLKLDRNHPNIPNPNITYRSKTFPLDA